jgi:hypothetical protein
MAAVADGAETADARPSSPDTADPESEETAPVRDLLDVISLAGAIFKDPESVAAKAIPADRSARWCKHRRGGCALDHDRGRTN